jgi:hypothetical protein
MPFEIRTESASRGRNASWKKPGLQRGGGGTERYGQAAMVDRLTNKNAVSEA